MASNSNMNSPILPEFELIQDFMPVQVICGFHKDPVKTKQAVLGTRLNMEFFWHKRASNSKVDILIWPEFKFVQDYIPIQVICKFQSKLSRLCSGKGCIWGFSALGKLQSQYFDLTGIGTRPRGYLQVLIKTKQAMLLTRSNMGFFGTEGQVTPM